MTAPSRPVPAWTVAISEHSAPGWVNVLWDEEDPRYPGSKRVRTVDALTPVRVVDQEPDGLKVVTSR